MTHQEAVANITWLYGAYISRYAGNLRDAVELFEVYVEQGGWSVQDAYDQVTSAVLHDAAFYDEAFPGYVPGVDEAFDENAIPAHLVLDYFYPSASIEDRSGLLAQMEAGAVSNRDFVYAWPFVATENATPDVAQVLEAVMEKTSSVPLLPRADLDISGMSDANLDFLISLYMASFGRAAEYAGLLWWAGEMERGLEAGASEADMMRNIAARMYDGGTAHGEAGTRMSDVEYVDHAYLNVLGRNAEEAGRHFWVGQLEHGLTRGEFVTAFLTATQHEDSEYLTARIQVGRHAAQEHVSGPGMPPIDLNLVLEGVGNAAQAYAAIQDILYKYGDGKPASSVAMGAEASMENAWTVAAEPGQTLLSAQNAEVWHDAGVVIIGLSAESEYPLLTE